MRFQSHRNLHPSQNFGYGQIDLNSKERINMEISSDSDQGERSAGHRPIISDLSIFGIRRSRPRLS
jgi:hypothetical protein